MLGVLQVAAPEGPASGWPPCAQAHELSASVVPRVQLLPLGVVRSPCSGPAGLQRELGPHSRLGTRPLARDQQHLRGSSWGTPSGLLAVRPSSYIYSHRCC